MVLYDLPAAKDRCGLRCTSWYGKLINEYGLDQKYDVQVTLSVSECLADLSILDGMETVFVSGVHSHERNIILKHCVGKGINMFVIPVAVSVIMSDAWLLPYVQSADAARRSAFMKTAGSCSLSARWTIP